MYNFSTSVLKRFIIGTVCTAAVIASAAAPQGMPAPTVRVEKVTTVTRGDARVYVGTVSPYNQVDVVVRVSGELWEQPFKKGSHVKKGDLLFHIEDTIYKENVNAARAELEQAEAEFNFAEKEKDRYTKLYNSNAAAAKDYESAIRTFKLRQAQKIASQAKLKLAENDLSYTKIYSTLDGKIGGQTYSVGNYLTPGSPKLTTIVQYDPIKILFSLSETDYFRSVKNGKLDVSAVEIVRADGKVCKKPVRIGYVDNLIDNKTGTIKVELQMENKDEMLFPGGYVKVKFRQVFDPPMASVSASAMMTDGKIHYVYVLDQNNTVIKREVVPGPQAGDKQTFASGVKVGETVIIGGQNKVYPGRTVTPVFNTNAN